MYSQLNVAFMAFMCWFMSCMSIVAVWQSPKCCDRTQLQSGVVTFPRKVCGLTCPGVEGQFPSVSCIVCMSMFHPACVDLPSGVTEFACKVSYYVNFIIVLLQYSIQILLECGPMPNVMATLPNIGGALCSTLQSLADAHYQSAVL